MPSTRFLVHGSFAAIAFSAAAGSIVATIKLGGLQFLKENFFEGLCVDVWDGFFLSPLNLVAISFLIFLPFHCWVINAPLSILCLTSIMGFPSFLFFAAAFLETSPVLLPIGLIVSCFGKFGLSELQQATHSSSSPKTYIHSKSPSPSISHRSSASSMFISEDHSTPASSIRRKRSHS
ncbi:uncharacterized protein MELLADRAFT_116053 [Melampsora larici-populina 98AG31]|uniref:Uncharacterized protein n=1 Tax=Melampsora larici-populina (strain 98AG31 / pathotype 3-4-7) TaxID=747676 RepID=F4RGS0_MELLP|nr:uncharacterized protein MELLADRAFT_116053 [Melampsora larici-populina 98AG31]EGG08185.1 hypothetical protein MELLADRAFT_116053 [Melampsora larici-populina 98AG31]